jgi:hypothetical protein
MKNLDRRKRGASDEDSTPLRQQVRDIVEGKFVIITMTLVTLYSLFGDDLRMWHADIEYDNLFFGGLLISLILFTLELLVQSCVVDDFKYSFFFWLDFVATLSLVIDIPWCMDICYRILEMQESKYSMDIIVGANQSFSGSNQIGEIVGSFRLIRLIRIIKLYNYARKSNAEAEEAKMRE